MLVLPIHEEVKSVWQIMPLSDVVYSENNKRIDILPKETAKAVKMKEKTEAIQGVEKVR